MACIYVFNYAGLFIYLFVGLRIYLFAYTFIESRVTLSFVQLFMTSIFLAKVRIYYSFIQWIMLYNCFIYEHIMLYAFLISLNKKGRAFPVTWWWRWWFGHCSDIQWNNSEQTWTDIKIVSVETEGEEIAVVNKEKLENECLMPLL